MVVASAKKKKKSKKSANGKRKPVNMQANYNSKFRSQNQSHSRNPSASDAPDWILCADMFPHNDHEDDGPQPSNNTGGAANRLGGASIGDFHMHSICSDGKLRPAQVIEKAASNGVKYMSLTDHDSMEGVREAIQKAIELNVLVVPGVEISAEVKGGENLHILGYFPPGSNSEELEQQLLKIRNGRHRRGKGMLRKLEELGVKLKWERVLEIAGEAAPGRPHVAQALVESGYVSHFKEAFSRYLHNDGPAYVEGEQFPPEDAIRLIDSAGGVSVLAHPWCCKNPIALVPELAALGLQGLEVYHDPSKIDMYGTLAKESGLLKLGGSDFHGIDNDAETAPGDLPFPKSQVERFLDHAQQKWQPWVVSRLGEMAHQLRSLDPALTETQPCDDSFSKEGDEPKPTTKLNVDLLIWQRHLPIALETASLHHMKLVGESLGEMYFHIRQVESLATCA